jgi:hypothetical protein
VDRAEPKVKTVEPTWAALVAALTAGAALAGCGGQAGRQSDREQVAAVVRSYDHAFVTHDNRRLCGLMTSSLRRELISGTKQAGPDGCAKLLAFAAGTVRDASGVHPVLSAVRISGSRATATIRTRAGVGMLPLARQGGSWRVSGTVHYVSRVYLKADYRITRALTA